jgi:UrcA family protein
MSRSTAITGLIATSLALVAFTCPASAGQSGAPLTVGISYSDLDLGTPAGAATLNRRIAAAANQLCAGHRGGPAPWSALRFRNCVNAAVANAQPQVAQAMARANAVQLARQAPIRIHDR